jgi:hypothetical protein
MEAARYCKQLKMIELLSLAAIQKIGFRQLDLGS